MRGFPLQDEGPGMNQLFADLRAEQEEQRERDRLIQCHKPQFLKWTDWILDGDAVTYGGGGYRSPSECRWLIPNTGHNQLGGW